MKQVHDFLVPDYFPSFQCKIDACRHACCTGWPVTIPLLDYFHLVSVNCSPDLRRRLDGALQVLPRPNNEEYARICPGYDGECRLRMPDGRCQIQVELGEDALPMICRLFPRGFRKQDDYECSCANSCEAVPEIFLDHPAPLQFIRVPISIDLPAQMDRENRFSDGGCAQDIRMYYIRIMQNRDQNLPERLMTLGLAMQIIEKTLKTDDRPKLAKILASVPERYMRMTEKPDQDQFNAGIEIVSAMMKQIDEKSVSVKEYGEAALQWFTEQGNSIEGYQSAITNFEAVVPNWPIVFEHLMVNHMFFEQFPFQDRPVPVKDEFLAVCAVYALLRFLSVGWTAVHPAVPDFVDACAALFRLISHTAFDRFAMSMMKQLGCTTPEKVCALISL